MKAMTATPPMVPTITAIMYFSENKGDQSTNIMAYNLIIKHIAHPTHRTTVHVANKKMVVKEHVTQSTEWFTGVFLTLKLLKFTLVS